jgi:hypothetical protein
MLAAVAVAHGRRAREGDAGRVSLMLEVTFAAARPPAHETESAAGLALALNAMTDERRREIAHALTALADQVERRQNPFVEDLGDDDASPEAQRLLREELPAMTAAAALGPGQWAAADGTMVVRATGACAPGTRCIPLVDVGADDADRVAARARFLAWPLAYAIGLRPRPEATRRVIDALRAPTRGSRIALVVGDEDRSGLRSSDALPELVSSARRLAAAHSEDPLVALMRHLSSPDLAKSDLRWLELLPRGVVLVVPRLGALAAIEAFRREVRDRLGAADVEWVFGSGGDVARDELDRVRP